MPGSNDKDVCSSEVFDLTLAIVNEWADMPPNTSPDFWTKTSELVSALRDTHNLRSPLNLITRKRACCQCLATISWAATYFSRARLVPGGCQRPFLETMVRGLIEVVRLLAFLLRPFNTALVSQLEEILVVWRLLDIPVILSEDMQDACLQAMRNFVDDRPEVVDAVLLEMKQQLKRNASRRKRRSARRSSPPVQPPSPPPVPPLLRFLSEASVGAQIPSDMLSRAHMIHPGPLTSVVEIHQVVTSDLLPVLVSLLNAPWRAQSHGYLVVGADPDSRRLRGILMNFEDQDSFRIGFDQHVQERLHPQPTASTVRLHFLPISGGSRQVRDVPSPTSGDSRRQLCERQQRERSPYVMVVEVGRILIEHAFAYADMDKVSKRRRYVTITMQPNTLKLVPSVHKTPPVKKDNETTKIELQQRIKDLDKMLAAAKLKG